ADRTHGQDSRNDERRGIPARAAQFAPPPSPVRHAEQPALLLRLLPDLFRPDADAGSPPPRQPGGQCLCRGRQLCGARQARAGGGRVMRPFIAELIWFVGGAAWFVIRFPHQRRARKVAVARSVGGRRDQILLGCSLTGLAIIPIVYLVIRMVAGHPVLGDYPLSALQAWIGVAFMLAALALFYETHRQLGRNWSVTLDTRKTHRLIASGVYARVRHPMYSAFWLLALAQAALIPNWIGGFSGIVGWGILFFLRV